MYVYKNHQHWPIIIMATVFSVVGNTQTAPIRGFAMTLKGTVSAELSAS